MVYGVLAFGVSGLGVELRASGFRVWNPRFRI